MIVLEKNVKNANPIHRVLVKNAKLVHFIVQDVMVMIQTVQDVHVPVVLVAINMIVLVRIVKDVNHIPPHHLALINA